MGGKFLRALAWIALGMIVVYTTGAAVASWRDRSPSAAEAASRTRAAEAAS